MSAKASHVFSTKNIGKFKILTFVNETLTNDVVSFEQLGPEHFLAILDPVLLLSNHTLNISIHVYRTAPDVKNAVLNIEPVLLLLKSHIVLKHFMNMHHLSRAFDFLSHFKNQELDGQCNYTTEENMAIFALLTFVVFAAMPTLARNCRFEFSIGTMGHQTIGIICFQRYSPTERNN